jgi:hypothetical protein
MHMANTSKTEAHHQVVRYSALIGGIFYGLLHQGTLQRKHDEDKVCPHSYSKSDADLFFSIERPPQPSTLYIISCSITSNESIPAPVSQSPIYPMVT